MKLRKAVEGLDLIALKEVTRCITSGVLVGHLTLSWPGGGEKGWELERINLQKFRSQGEVALIDRHIRKPD